MSLKCFMLTSASQSSHNHGNEVGSPSDGTNRNEPCGRGGAGRPACLPSGHHLRRRASWPGNLPARRTLAFKGRRTYSCEPLRGESTSHLMRSPPGARVAVRGQRLGQCRQRVTPRILGGSVSPRAVAAPGTWWLSSPHRVQECGHAHSSAPHRPLFSISPPGHRLAQVITREPSGLQGVGLRPGGLEWTCRRGTAAELGPHLPPATQAP